MLKICSECFSLHETGQPCPPLVQCEICATMYREGKGCLVCVLMNNHQPSASLIFKKLQERAMKQREEALEDEVDDLIAQVECVRVPEPEPESHEERHDCGCEACKRARFDAWQMQRWEGR